MAWCAGALALWCAVVLAVCAPAASYTVDCNHEYTDCDTELSKLSSDDDEAPSNVQPPIPAPMTPPITTTTIPTTSITPKINEVSDDKPVETTPELPITTDLPVKPRPRLLNLSVDDLQNFANALHNQTQKDDKKLVDLSDVNLDADEDDEPPRVIDTEPKPDKTIPDKFYTNLQAPFHPLLSAMDRSEELDTCKENGINYKIGDHIDRGCEESCECTPGGIFDCSPRCKHPYIRRGRRLSDPLCFESPVDECCSIVACATGNGEAKATKIEVCRYGNGTYPVGTKWHVDCEQTCSCEANSVVTCKQRCNRLPPSDKCINVQDPNDECCEVQVCDVSQDVHEEPLENVTSSTTTTTESVRGFTNHGYETSSMRPLVLPEPIGSVKVLQNNSVQVNLIHMNNSLDPIHLLLSNDGGQTFQDVELKYSNLILNLEGGKDYILKTKETGTKFNFTITTIDTGTNEVPEETDQEDNGDKLGCHHDGKFYAIGEEFHIGCTELCECTGPESSECAALICPSHVGLELVSKGCVRWAPNPPPQPPNCCPRAARCLSDGTCYYKGVAVPNWSEVPLSLTGCEQRCFCENGDLDCQEVCTPLPPVPPQTLRCPPMHRPAAVNISDEDCCKQWGCVPNAGHTYTTTVRTFTNLRTSNFVTPVSPVLSTTASVLPTPPITTDPTNLYGYMNPVKTFPKFRKPIVPVPLITINPKYMLTSRNPSKDNVTVFTIDNMDSPLGRKPSEPTYFSNDENWGNLSQNTDMTKILEHIRKVQPNDIKLSYVPKNLQSHKSDMAKVLDSAKKIQFTDKTPQSPKNAPKIFIPSKKPQITIEQQSKLKQSLQINSLHNVGSKHIYDTIRRVPFSKVDNINLFLPATKKNAGDTYEFPNIKTSAIPPVVPTYIESLTNNFTNNLSPPPIPYSKYVTPREHSFHKNREKHVTILKTQDLKTLKPTDTMETDGYWATDTKTHILTKAPSPYETVLLRAIPNAKVDVPSTLSRNEKVSSNHGKMYSTIDLDHILSQMDLNSDINRNLGRSADKNQSIVLEAQTSLPDNPPHHQQPFLPTILPEIQYPQEDIPDYDQNNIHRPVNGPLDPNLSGLPPGLHIPTNYKEENKKLAVISLQADSPTSVKMLFGLPPVLVGLRGSVDLRYTDKADEDISHWYSQVFAPADEILTTPRLEFRLTGLKPATTYKVRAKLYLHNLPVEPESEVYTVRTEDIVSEIPAEEKRREIDSRLTVVDVNDTTAHVSWRHFTDEELQFIDGIQVRYRPVGTPIYSMTELLHHSRSLAELHELRPGTRYEASLVLVPPPRAVTELHDPGRVEFTTAPYVDPYNWSVVIEARAVGSEAAELTWRGVPSPAERWVRVYRAAHACGSSTRKEHDAFRLAARDVAPSITLTGLEPDNRCRVWLELFLTNGKVKTSNVLEINTKSVDSSDPVDNQIEASSIAGSRSSPRGDYYGALVVVGVVAALGALTSMLLLLIVVKRHRPRSVPITPVPSAPRESSLPPYDNPAYKLELQQETMDL